jgi:hypothetical protein
MSKEKKGRNAELISDVWRLGSLTECGKKYGITKERVRQILLKEGLNAVEINRAKRDFEEFNLVEEKYHICVSCGRG